MELMRLTGIVIFAALIMPVAGCKNKSTHTDNVRKMVDVSLSRKLTVVSAGFLSPEMERARQDTHNSTVEFGKNGTGVVYVEPFKGKYRVVHNGQPGESYFAISELSISSDGNRVAYVARVDEKNNYRMVVDGKEGFPFGANDGHEFSPDGKHHLSTVSEGANRYLVIDNRVNRDYRIEQGPVICSDSEVIAFSTKSPDGSREQFVISDMNLQNKTVIDFCGEIIVANDDRTRLAVVCSEGDGKSLKVFDFPKRNLLSESKYNGTITHLRFSPDNRSLTYTYFRKENQAYLRFVVYNGKEERIPAGDEFLSDPLVFSEPESVGVIIGDVYKARLYRAFHRQKRSEKGYGYTSDFVSSKDGRHYAFIAVNHNEERQYIVIDGNEGVKFDKIVSPIFSPDGKFLVYRAKQAGKRFLVVSDLRGKIIRQHRDYAMVFQPVFVDNGKSVAYIVLDGNEFWWKVEKL